MMIVVAIIGTLIGLLIPAVQAVRNAAKKVQNQNNMKQILLAMQNYISHNNGILPQATGWQGENCGGSQCTSSGTPYQQGWTQTCTNCSNPLIGTVVSKYINGALTPTSITYNASNTRTDWTEGTPFFMLLPYMDYKNVWDDSYGPMSSGSVYQEGDSQVNTLISSTANFGWQGGRRPSPIKTFAGYGDPTADYPGILAPLSYPMMGNFTGSIENYNSSYRSLITESYTGCPNGMDYGYIAFTQEYILPWDGNSNYNLYNPPATTGQYNSWAASLVVNADFNPPPLLPVYGFVQGNSSSATLPTQIWTGIGVGLGDTLCETLHRKNGSINATACSCQGMISDPNFPPDLKDAAGNPPKCIPWKFAGGNLRLITNPSWGRISTHTDNSMASPEFCGQNPDSPECHVGEWYFYWPVTYTNHNYWLDHPNPVNLTSLGAPVSLVPGSLNIGFLDGSVRSIGKDISANAWRALLAGQAPIDNVSTW